MPRSPASALCEIDLSYQAALKKYDVPELKAALEKRLRQLSTANSFGAQHLFRKLGGAMLRPAPSRAALNPFRIM